jgi:hypothetical protein
MPQPGRQQATRVTANRWSAWVAAEESRQPVVQRGVLGHRDLGAEGVAVGLVAAELGLEVLASQSRASWPTSGSRSVGCPDAVATSQPF